MNKAAMHRNKKDNWETPLPLFNRIEIAFYNKGLYFYVDVAADSLNCLCPYYIDKALNALTVNWDVSTYYLDRRTKENSLWWCNPPFSKKIQFIKHAEKMARKGLCGVMLLPASVGSKWFTDLARERPMLLLPKRIHFKNPDGGSSSNTGGSCLFYFGNLMCKQLPKILDTCWVLLG